MRISPPPKSGSYYYNYKGFFSIILMAVVNANYEFMYLDIGKNGRNSDAGVIDQTEFYKRLLNGTLNLPAPEDNIGKMNFVFVADDAFALLENVLKPFPMRNLTREQRIFNYRLSRARRVVENAFGIMANRFRIFLTTINLAIYKVNKLVLCCCVLHNFLRRHAARYISTHQFDEDPARTGNTSGGQEHELLDAMTPIGMGRSGLATQNARQNRLNYMHYFNGVGAVEWQNDM